MTDGYSLININGQINISKDNSTLYASQYLNDINNDIYSLIESIEDDLQKLKKDEAEALQEVVTMIKDELHKSNPKKYNIERCIKLLAPMFTIINGIPTLVNNLHYLVEKLATLF